MNINKFNTHKIVIVLLSLIISVITVCTFSIDSIAGYAILLPTNLVLCGIVVLLLHYFRINYPNHKGTMKSLVYNFMIMLSVAILVVLTFFMKAFITAVTLMIGFAITPGLLLGYCIGKFL